MISSPIPGLVIEGGHGNVDDAAMFDKIGEEATILLRLAMLSASCYSSPCNHPT